MSDGVATPEAGGVQDFIRERQPGVLERAIEALSTCPDDELISTTHRLSGTLGTYQLTDAARVVRDLYDRLRLGEIAPADTPRGETIEVLVRTLDEIRATEGGSLP